MEETNQTRKRTPLKIAAWVVGGVLLAIVFAFVFGYFVMLLWNWLMPEIFGLPAVTYWQAVGIIILSRLIFGGLGNNHSDKNKKHKNLKSKFNCKDDFLKDSEDWRYYHEYWKDEGESAFKNYLNKKREQ
ncbi:MAG: RnfABCDGE type electron transport complex subunit D [Bacteroidetes bacterium]|nr:RnfABCDGE type electron transport complex subunit D [Bacteroidota bacterium]